MTSRIEFRTGRQLVRLALGLVVVFGLAALFAVAALVTADSTAKQIGAWALCGVFTVFGGLVAWGGVKAMGQALVVTTEGIAREGGRRPMRIGWSELRAVAVEKSWTYTSYKGPLSLIPPPKVWRVVLRLAPKDPADFATRHRELDVYRGRFGARDDEWGIFLGPPREVIEPLDTALRAYGGGRYQGHFDNGEQPRYSLFVRTADLHPDGRPLP